MKFEFYKKPFDILKPPPPPPNREGWPWPILRWVEAKESKRRTAEYRERLDEYRKGIELESLNSFRQIEASLIEQILPGDTVILRYPQVLTDKAIDLRQSIERIFPGTKCIVLEEGLSMEVCRQEQSSGVSNA